MPHSPRRRVFVLGGGYAGLVAATRIARGATRTDVTLVDARDAFVQRSWSRWRRRHQWLAQVAHYEGTRSPATQVPL